MAHLPQPYSAYHVFAQKYIERCKQVQKLANLHPTYNHQTFPAYEKPSSVVVLDDDDTVQVQDETNNTQSSIRLLDILVNDFTNNQPPSTNLQNYSSCPGESTDLHITGVSLLREWIDISELDVKNHLNSDVPQAQICDVQRQEERRNTETIPTEKRSTLEAPHHVLSNKRKQDWIHDSSKRRRLTSEKEEPTVAAEKIEAPHPSNELLNQRKDDVRVLRSHDKRISTPDQEESPKRRRTRKEMSFTFEDGEDSCYEPDEDWVEMGEEEESDEVEDDLTNVREKSVKRKKVKVRRKQRRKSVLKENTNVPNSILGEETKKHDEANEQALLKEQLDVSEGILGQQLPIMAEASESTLTEEEENKDNVEEKMDVPESVGFQDERDHPPTNTEQPKENILTEEKEKDNGENESVSFYHPPTNTEQPEDSNLNEEKTEHAMLNEENDIEERQPNRERKVDAAGSISSVDKDQAEPTPDKIEKVGIPVLELQTPGEENAKPEDPEVEILGDNWADVDVVEVNSSEEDETRKEKEEKYKCDQCSYKTNWKSNLSKHVVSRHQTSSEIKWFECAHCPYRGKTREYLRSHLRQTHEQFITWYNCTKCHLKFKAKQFLEYHVLAVHTAPENVQWFKCEQCDFKCRVKIRLKEHKLNKHTNEDEIKWYRCRVCVYKGKSKKALSRHEKNKHVAYDEMEWFKCDKCDYEGSDRLYLRRHVKANHPEVIQMELDDISEKQLECKICGVKMFSKSKFLEHFRWSKECYF